MSGTGRERLEQIIARTDKQDFHLAGVRRRFFGNRCNVDAERLEQSLGDAAGIDQLESFGAKFGRMQDTVVDKLIPAVLREAGEPVAAAMDNLGRMEKLELVTLVDEWLAMRVLRNRLTHDSRRYAARIGELTASNGCPHRFAARTTVRPAEPPA